MDVLAWWLFQKQGSGSGVGGPQALNVASEHSRSSLQAASHAVAAEPRAGNCQANQTLESRSRGPQSRQEGGPKAPCLWGYDRKVPARSSACTGEHLTPYAGANVVQVGTPRRQRTLLFGIDGYMRLSRRDHGSCSLTHGEISAAGTTMLGPSIPAGQTLPR